MAYVNDVLSYIFLILLNKYLRGRLVLSETPLIVYLSHNSYYTKPFFY